MQIAETSLSCEARFGKTLMSRVLALIERLSRSSRLLVRSFLRMGSGREKIVRPSGMFSSAHDASLGWSFAYFVTNSPRSRCASSSDDALKIARMSEATCSLFLGVEGDCYVRVVWRPRFEYGDFVADAYSEIYF